MQKSGIASSFGQERRRGGECRFREKQAVERAVDHVAQRAGENQRETDQHACRGLFTKQMVDVVAERADSYEPEYAENQFAIAASELEPECGSRILYEPDEEPVRKDGHALVEREVGLDPYFDDLVDGQQRDDQQGDFFLGHGFARFPVAKMSHFSETDKFRVRPVSEIAFPLGRIEPAWDRGCLSTRGAAAGPRSGIRLGMARRSGSGASDLSGFRPVGSVSPACQEQAAAKGCPFAAAFIEPLTGSAFFRSSFRSGAKTISPARSVRRRP